MAVVFPPQGARAQRPREPGVGELAARLIGDVRQLASDFAQLAVLDARRAGVHLAMLLSAGLLIAILVITAWMGLVAAGIVWMFDQGGVSWPVAIAVAALVNVLAAAVLAWWARHLVSEMPFTALLRQLRGDPPKNPDE